MTLCACQGKIVLTLSSHSHIPLTADVDFSTVGFPQVVTIPAGQTSVQFTVTVIDELIVERDEQFQLSFTYSGSQPGVIVRPGFDQANITIRNDDGMYAPFCSLGICIHCMCTGCY